MIWELMMSEGIKQERQCAGMNGTLKILGETGGVRLLLSGQTGHGRAGHSVLFSLRGSPEKVQDGADIILRSLLIGVVATFGENS
jgi:molybdopterin biosynthesis enzyme MoaB